MPYGYAGQVLKVDLSESRIEVEKPPESFYRTYLGGSALNLSYLLDHQPPGADPLGPENILALSVGVTTGFSISGQSRVTATAKSPLTGAIGDSQSGGFWPARLKFAGFDAVIVTGRAPKPVYLRIHDGQAEIRDATHLWGRTTGDAQKAIRTELDDPRAEVLQIGPAGEKMVRFASLINMCNRANGRTGLGAVMGSKNLKAVAVSGGERPHAHDEKALKELIAWSVKTYKGSDLTEFGQYGTNSATAGQQRAGGLPSYNYQSGVFDRWQAINAQAVYETLLRGRETDRQNALGRDTCYGCVIRCKRVVELKEGDYLCDPLYGGPEYETTAAFGAYCGVDNLPAIAKANEICNRYGLDTISCGGTIAWAMEAFEEGVLTLEDTGGLELRFGRADIVVKLTEMIAQRQGFGDLLAEGSERAARKLGKGFEFLTTSKGQEAPAHMPHMKRSLALVYAANPFGADHQSHQHDPAYEAEVAYEYFAERLNLMGLDRPQPKGSLGAEKIRYVKKTQALYSAMDSLNLCQFAWGPAWQLLGPEEMVKLVRFVTGWDFSLDELLEVGERRLNMMRVFNAREAFGREQDRLPEKFFLKPLRGGPSDGIKLDPVELETALDEYYEQVGWEKTTGWPASDTLKRLKLDWLIGTFVANG